ncbi:hypothetical protein ACP70R_025676 [Stipagrostis hirtigluma subsp. patula]
MVAAAEEEEAEFIDYDQDGEDAMDEDGRRRSAPSAPHRLPRRGAAGPASASPVAAPPSSPVASSRDCFDSLSDVGDQGVLGSGMLDQRVKRFDLVHLP